MVCHNNCAMLTPTSASLTLLLGLVYTQSSSSPTQDARLLTDDQLPKLLGKGVFLIESGELNKCVAVESSAILLQDCNELSEKMCWKWVSRHHIYNIGSSRCLGLNISNLSSPLEMFDCDSSVQTLSWKCSNNSLIGANRYNVAVVNGKVVARTQLYYQWRVYKSSDEAFCEQSYQEVYTLLGNSRGSPCFFPFKYNNLWYHECLNKGRQDGLSWCSTTVSYNNDRKWGFCPSTGSGCGKLWEKNNVTTACYQFNIDSSLSWSEARVSCQQQDGDLLSINHVNELKYISDKLQGKEQLFWMGLNHLNEAEGWQWSDGSPLVLLNWAPGSPSSYAENCGVYLQGYNTWNTYSCGIGLPYICKKYTLPVDQETFDSWKYYPTNCEFGWYPYNHYCYKLQREMQTWDNASAACQRIGGELTSVTSSMEFVVMSQLLENENVTEAWIGMKASLQTPYTFQWTDGSTVTITNWYRHQPYFNGTNQQFCVSTQKNKDGWKVKICDEKLFSVCKKLGQNDTDFTKEDQCGKNWERYGSYCYRVDDTKRTWQQASTGYYCSSPLAVITDRFEQAFISNMISIKIQTEDNYFWIGLQDQTKSGEYTWTTSDIYRQPVTYTNWNKHQPSRTGGCVTLRNGKNLGLWEVKDCTLFKAMSVCKKALSGVIEEPPDSHEKYPDIQDMCEIWESEPHFHHCYKVYHNERVLRKRTWEEAEHFCQGFGAQLVSFSHLEEETFVAELLDTMFHRYEKRQFWIGFNKRNPSARGSWEWSDGTSVVSPFLEDMYDDDESTNCAVYRADKKVVPMRCDAKHEWICKMPRGLPPKLPEWHAKGSPWLFYRGYEYWFIDQLGSFDLYQFACGWIGAEIVTIHSPDEQSIIHSRIKKLSKKKTNWWIGQLYENSRDGSQRWKDGTPLLYKNWENEPTTNNITLNGPQCAYMSSETGLWGYSECHDLNPSICKTDRKLLDEIEIYQDSKNGSCPTKWIHYQQKCFFVYKGEYGGSLDNWFAAQEYCNNHNGNLVSIENNIEQAFVVMQLFGEKNGFWIHLQNSDYEKWESGISKKYANWSPIQINSDNVNSSSENKQVLCGLISSNDDVHAPGKWYLTKCDSKGYGFVCEKKQARTENFNETDMYPVEGILEYGHERYRVISGNITWYDAYTNCQSQGAHLSSVTDDYHQAFLTIIVNRLGYSHWIGFFSPDNGRHFEWADRSNSTFTAWRNEESLSDGNCAYIDIDGYWRTEDCNTEMHGAVCLIANNYTRFVDHPADKTRTHHVIIPAVVMSLVILLILLIFLWYLLKGNKPVFFGNPCLQKMHRSEPDANTAEESILITEINTNSRI